MESDITTTDISFDSSGRVGIILSNSDLQSLIDALEFAIAKHDIPIWSWKHLNEELKKVIKI